MANNETTTKFNVDISELKKAMQDAKRSIAVANSEFKAVASSMDDWSKSTDGLQAKLKQLDSNLKSQKTILGSLEAQYEEVVRTQGEGSKAADDLKIKINNQKSVINQTEREIGKYNDALEDLKSGSKTAVKNNKEVAESLDNVADSGKDAGDGFTVFKGAIATMTGNLLTSFVGAIGSAVGSLVSLADETREYRQEMGKLETAFTSAGHSTEAATKTYKDLYAVLGDEGQSVEAANMLAKLTTTEKELAEWTNIATGVYGTFGSSLPIESLTEAANETAKTGALTGALADALNWAGVNEDDFQASLDACTTEQERNALITSTLNGLYSEAADKYKELNGAIMDSQRAESELADATAKLGAVFEPIMTTLKLFGAEIINSVLPYVQLLGSSFTDLMNGVDGGAESMGTALGGIVNTLLDTLVSALPQIVDVALTLVTTLLDAIIDALPQVTKVALTLVNGLIQALLSALPSIIKALVDLTKSVLESLGTILPEIITAIVEIIPELIDAIMSQLPVFINACVDFLMAIVHAIPIVVTAILNALPMLITSIIDGLISGIGALLEGAITLLMAIVEAIPTIIVELVKAIPDILTAIINALITAVPQVLQAAITLLMALIEAIPTIIVELVGAIPDIVDAIINTLLNNLPLLLSAAVTLLWAIIDAIPKILTSLGSGVLKIVTTIIDTLKTLIPKLTKFFSQVWDMMTEWLDGVVDKFKGLPDKIKTIGSDIVKGLWNGINDMTSWVTGKIQSFGESVLGGIKDFFGIHSPSKLMADEVGKWIPEGIAVGIDKNAKSVLSSMRDLTYNSVGAARDGLGTATGGFGGGVVYNFNQVNNSPKALSRLEIYRQSKNLLGYAGGV